MTEQRSPSQVVQAALSVRPTGLLTDIDGTISRIAGHPDEARVETAARDRLRQLVSTLDLVAAITGRSVDDAREMVGLEGMVYSGNHGMEIWRDGRLEQSALAQEYVPRVDELLNSLREAIALDGIYFENKGLTASVHVRGADDPDSAERKILDSATSLAERLDLRITRGRMVIEIRPPVELNKGTSVRDLIDRYQLAGGIFIGDDRTDVDAFGVLREHRERSGRQFYAVGVATEETPQVVLDQADALVDGVDGVIDLLDLIYQESSRGTGEAP